MGFNRFCGGWVSQLKQLSYCLIIFLVLLPASVQAHVKWFAPYDVADAPKSIDVVLTSKFLFIGLLSIIAVFVLSFLDRQMVGVNSCLNVKRQNLTERFAEHYPLTMIRYGLLVFFVSIWSIGGIVLTPELKHHSAWISGLQVIMIVALLNNRTTWLAGVGIFILWIYSAINYGFFHLSDYMIFLGLALFVIFSSADTKRVSEAQRFNVLYGAIAFTLLWASVEKFVYPEWSYPILEKYPHIRFGFTSQTFMELAGFGEFFFAFLLISMVGIGFWLGTVTLATMFIAAIWDFGKIDAVGHLMIIVALFLMMAYGPSSLNRRFANLHSRPLINALYITLIYSVALVFFFVIYYGIRQFWLLTATH